MQVTVSLKIELDATATVDQMEKQVQEAGREAMKEALKQAIRQSEEQQKRCPHCGSEQSQSKGTIQRIILSSFGRVQVALRRKLCLQCGQRFRPAQGCFASLTGHNITAQLRELAALVGSSWPYETAADVLKRMTGAHISDERLRQLTNEQGSAVAEQLRCEAMHKVEPTIQQIRAERDEEARCKERRTVLKEPHWLQVGLDGGWIPSREQKGGMEGKIAVVASEVETVGKRGRHRLRRREYMATFASSEEVGRLAYAAACNLRATQASKQVVLGDGAEWIKTQAREQFPQAKHILDWAHLWRKIHDAIRAVHPGKSPARRAWRKQQYERLKALLWKGRVEEAAVHLQTLRPAERSEPIKRFEDAIQYLRAQRDWIGNYEQLRADGYPVGSGLVERAVAVVINARMKKRGMRWKRKNATAVVTLRVLQINARWQEALVAA